jgi:hypothetical protein
LRGLSLIIAASLPELCGFFSLSSYVSDDISVKNSASWVIFFAMSLYIMKASLSHWASRLLHCEREAFLIKELQTKIFFHLGQCNFVSHILRHIARHRKKSQGTGLYREAAIMIER